MFSKAEEIVGRDYISNDPGRLKDFTVDGKLPKVVIYPANVEEISQVIKLPGIYKSGSFSGIGNH